ncbi:hypothetical protein Ataiwa_14710 [Algoriphagus taiwanensis]|uniref:FbpB family small basic protein n=1 Tax=Algoriphagus taiwanensis TaxID=1445656 RepID=A0ABQ6PZ17_9BACT|nr:hypothetical protein Ataiwa_14710 [Algoriphagus taiwanensis]
MKTADKSFDAVKFMRQERERISKELVQLTNEEILEHFRKKRLKRTPKS